MRIKTLAAALLSAIAALGTLGCPRTRDDTTQAPILRRDGKAAVASSVATGSALPMASAVAASASASAASSASSAPNAPNAPNAPAALVPAALVPDEEVGP